MWEAGRHPRLFWFRIDRDWAVVSIHDDAARDVEPEPHAFPDVLGPAERLERAGPAVRSDPGPGIADLDDYCLGVGTGPGTSMLSAARMRATRGSLGPFSPVAPHDGSKAGGRLKNRQRAGD